MVKIKKKSSSTVSTLIVTKKVNINNLWEGCYLQNK